LVFKLQTIKVATSLGVWKRGGFQSLIWFLNFRPREEAIKQLKKEWNEFQSLIWFLNFRLGQSYKFFASLTWFQSLIWFLNFRQN